jgi:D-alanyl-lipoteichoic acid acyltransferase DltB (MBOAT superfamily)
MLTMLLGGLWHGAAWTFVIWGALHGLYLAVHKAIGGRRGREIQAPVISTPRQLAGFFLRVAVTFHLVCLAWLFFRAGSIEQAWLYLAGLAKCTLACDLRTVTVAGFYLTLMLLIDLPCWAFDRELPLNPSSSWYIRGAAQAAAVVLLSFVGASGVQKFIYFQF